MRDATLDALDAAAFAETLRAKVGGAVLLDRLTEAEPLDFFLLYSSISAAVGRHGQAAYAAANGYLDALAQRRRLRARPALSIGWGSWAAGMGAADAKTAERIRAGGLNPLSEGEAFAALERAFTGEPHLVVAAIDLARIAAQPDLPPLIEGLVGRAPAANAHPVFRPTARPSRRRAPRAGRRLSGRGTARGAVQPGRLAASDFAAGPGRGLADRRGTAQRA